MYPGNGDYTGLLKETDLTDETFARKGEAKEWIVNAQKTAAEESEPNIATGDHCCDPFECGFCNYCNRGKREPKFPIDWLPNLSAARRAQMAQDGIVDLRKTPDGLLNEKQRMVKRLTLKNETFFDSEGAAADLAPHGLPAFFLDFETIQFAVPIWKGTRPYQQVSFQFSLHKVSTAGQLSHQDFLDLSGNDPSERFARALISGCEKKGPIFAYNAGFESARISELAERFPSLARSLADLRERIVDLLPIARSRYYHPSQHGSWSIKAVLPAAVPELTYEKLDGLKDGGMAMVAYGEAIQAGTPEERKREIGRQLQTYCRLDTFGLVRLWQFFRGKPVSALSDAD